MYPSLASAHKMTCEGTMNGRRAGTGGRAHGWGVAHKQRPTASRPKRAVAGEGTHRHVAGAQLRAELPGLAQQQLQQLVCGNGRATVAAAPASAAAAGWVGRHMGSAPVPAGQANQPHPGWLAAAQHAASAQDHGERTEPAKRAPEGCSCMRAAPNRKSGAEEKLKSPACRGQGRSSAHGQSGVARHGASSGRAERG